MTPDRDKVLLLEETVTVTIPFRLPLVGLREAQYISSETNHEVLDATLKVSWPPALPMLNSLEDTIRLAGSDELPNSKVMLSATTVDVPVHQSVLLMLTFILRPLSQTGSWETSPTE